MEKRFVALPVVPHLFHEELVALVDKLRVKEPFSTSECVRLLDVVKGQEALIAALKGLLGPPIFLKVGDRVRWTSQSQGESREKEGMIVQAVLQGELPDEKFIKWSCYQNVKKMDSYVVQVGEKFYWPRVSALVLVD